MAHEWRRRLARATRPFNQSSWIYVLVHGVVVLAGTIIYQAGGGWGPAVGSGLIATGIAGWVIFFWIRQSEDYASSLRALMDLGVVGAFRFRSVAIRHEYEPRFNAARDRIMIMGFGLRALREDFGDKFEDWARHAQVRILIINPDAPNPIIRFADQRDLEEGNPVGSIRSDVGAFLSFTEDLRLRMPDRFQVRLYNCLPSINVCIIDNEAFWGPYVFGVQSRNMFTVICRNRGSMFDSLEAHFEAIWADPQFSRPTI
jgi:hypothetical protein